MATLVGCWVADGVDVAAGVSVRLGVSTGDEDWYAEGDGEFEGCSVGLTEADGDVEISGVSVGFMLGDSLGSGELVGVGVAVGVDVGVGVGDVGGVPAPCISAAWGTVYLVAFSGAVMF